MEESASSVGCGAAVVMDVSLVGADALCPADCAPPRVGNFCASALAVATATTWLLATSGSVFGCVEDTGGVEAMTTVGRALLVWDADSGFDCGAGVTIPGPFAAAPDEMPEVVAVFDCGAGVTTIVGKPVSVAMLV